MMRDVIERVRGGQSLTQVEMAAVMDEVMQGATPEAHLEEFLAALHAKGETVDEIAGAAQTLRRHMQKIHSPHAAFIDTCGTGGVSSRLFNISTTAAIVTAAAGVPVAKHGNRSATSRSGSADVLTALGVNIQASVPQVERCLAELGLAFCFAPLMHPAMKHVAAVRKKMQTPTIFNLLGPLCNPASAPFQLLGVGRRVLCAKLAEAIQRLGTRRTAVVHGGEGVGELSLAGPSLVHLVTGESITSFSWQPSDFGLACAPMDTLEIENAEQSAQVVGRILAGEPGPARDIVVLNAAAALWVAGRDADCSACARHAAAAIDSGAAREKLAQLATLSHLPA